MSKRKPSPWPLPKLLAANRNAATVYAALRWLASERRQLNTTRARITEVCGLHKDTITAAMQVLAKSEWIGLNYGRRGDKTWYRLTFPGPGFFPVAPKNSFSATGGSRKNRSQRAIPCGRENRSPSPKGEEGDPPPSDAGVPPSATEHPSVIRERELLAAAKAEREQQERQGAETR